MDKLISLADLITRQKMHQVDIIDEHFENDSKISLLYGNIVEGKITNDEDAYQILYSGDFKKENLKKLKERLYTKLINSVFFIDQSGPNYQNIFNAGKTCYKNYAAVKLLLANRKRDVAVDLAIKTFRISSKYEFTDLNYLLTSLLSNHYALFSIKKHNFSKFKKLKAYYFEALIAENLAEEINNSFNLSLTNQVQDCL